MAAENNLIKKADLARAREVDFVYRFTDSIKKLVEALGVTRTIPKAAGTYLKAYKATGTLQDGLVAEGDLIPLSHYKTVPVNFGEIPFKNYIKIDNTNLQPDAVAGMIKENFNLPDRSKRELMRRIKLKLH